MTDVAIARIQQVQEYHEEKIDDHEKRLRDVEKVNFKLAVQVGFAVGLVSSILSAVLGWALHRFAGG